MSKSKVTGFRLPDEIVFAVKVEAAKERVYPCEIIKRAVAQYLGENEIRAIAEKAS